MCTGGRLHLLNKTANCNTWIFLSKSAVIFLRLVYSLSIPFTSMPGTPYICLREKMEVNKQGAPVWISLSNPWLGCIKNMEHSIVYGFRYDSQSGSLVQWCFNLPNNSNKTDKGLIGSQLHATPFIWKGGQLPKPAIVQLVCGYLRLTRELGGKGSCFGHFWLDLDFGLMVKLMGAKMKGA